THLLARQRAAGRAGARSEDGPPAAVAHALERRDVLRLVPEAAEAEDEGLLRRLLRHEGAAVRDDDAAGAEAVVAREAAERRARRRDDHVRGAETRLDGRAVAVVALRRRLAVHGPPPRDDVRVG